MKTYIINSLKEAVKIGKKLDSVSQLQNKEWTVFTDETGVVEKYLFLKKGKLINSINGVSSYYTWEYLSVNSSIIIDNKVSKLLFRVMLCDENILILNLDGTQEYCFLINTTAGKSKLLTYEDIQWYLVRHCHVDILMEQQRLEFEAEKRKKEEERKIKEEKERKEEEDFNTILSYTVIGILVVILVIAIFRNLIE